VVLSPGVNIWFGAVIRGDIARIVLGPRVNIQDGSIVHTDHEMPQTIDEGVVVGHGAVLHGTHIGRDTLIGIGATCCRAATSAKSASSPRGRWSPKIAASRHVARHGRARQDRSCRNGRGAETHPAINAHYLETAQRYARGGYPPPWMR